MPLKIEISDSNMKSRLSGKLKNFPIFHFMEIMIIF